MRVAIILFAAAGIAMAGEASASQRVSDVDYLKASRCKGLATGLGADTVGLDAFLKAESRTRPDFVLHMGENEATRAKRQAADANLKPRLEAELSGACTAYSGTGRSLAAQ